MKAIRSISKRRPSQPYPLRSSRALGLPAHDGREGAINLITTIRELEAKLHQPQSVRELGIAADAYANALPELIARAEIDTQIVTSPRIPDTAELRRLFEYAYEGKSIDF